jgi:cystathionine beta-synthase
MDYYDNVLERIGHTPLVKLNKLAADTPATVLAKIEADNPGNSVKDRIAVRMIEDAEQQGLLKPGGTIIEGTSGNTGLGLAITAIVKGYKCICTVADKQSKEKIDILKAVGAEVIVCPTAVAPDDPKSYYSVAKKLNDVIPNSFYPNQYFNYSNVEAHYETTGPEIWEQTDGKITHFIAGVGTGGTISGVGRYLKDKNPDVKVWGVDPMGSAFKAYHETGEFKEEEVYPYLTEGIGEDILPSNVDFSIIDHFEKVTDKDGYLMTRRVAKEEGILAGNSCGSALAGFDQLKPYLTEDDVVVVLLPDHATRYLGKAFNDEWMRERGFLESSSIAARDIVGTKADKNLLTLKKDNPVSEAINVMYNNDIAQLPIINEQERIVGSITENLIYTKMLDNPDVKHLSVENIMADPFPELDSSATYNQVSSLLNKENNAVLIRYEDGSQSIITKYDMLQALTTP